MMNSMRVFIGTSGWSYNWNKGKSLDWYAHDTDLNAIELNMSFYRFPDRHMIESCAKKAH